MEKEPADYIDLDGKKYVSLKELEYAIQALIRKTPPVGERRYYHLVLLKMYLAAPNHYQKVERK